MGDRSMPRLLDELDVFRGPFAVDGTIRTCLLERKKLIYKRRKSISILSIVNIMIIFVHC